MKKLTYIFVLPLLIAGLKGQAATPSTAAMLPASAVTTAAVAGSIPLKNSFEAYFSLKNALVLTDAVQAKQTADKLYKELAKVDKKVLNANEQAIWTSLGNRMKSNAKQIASSTNIEEQRKLFLTVSTDFVALAKVASKDEPFYAMHCPMANGNKGGDWLSKETAVKNPYFGNKMMTCGKVKETLK